MPTYTGTSGPDVLRETSHTGDTLIGGGGDDTYYWEMSSYYVSGFPQYGIPGYDQAYRTKITENPNEGYDTVYVSISYPNIAVSHSELGYAERIIIQPHMVYSNGVNAPAVPDTSQILTLTLDDTATLVYGSYGKDTINGNGGNDQIYGGPSNDTLNGGAGDDLLDGESGNDTMAGGTGNDTFYVDSASDVVTENANEGNDWVYAGANFTLPTNVEWLTLTGGGTWTGVGNAANNNMYGNVWNNVLNGLGGTDFMAGGRGDDAYVVDYAGDVAYEAPGEGGDTVVSYVSYQLFNQSSIEALVLMDSGGAINGVGSDFNNLIQGNNSANALVGGKGDDQLIGRGGADRFIFSAGDGGDTISDFSHGEGDKIDLRVPGIHTFSDVQPLAVDHGTYTTLNFGAAGSVSIIGLHPANLQASDFLFN